LDQTEADRLFQLQKRESNNVQYIAYQGGPPLEIPIVSIAGHEPFILDIAPGRRIKLSKLTLQKRYQSVIVLARLDIDGPPHRNPDDELIPCPHLHLYREGFGDKWATSMPLDIFSNPGDHWQIIQEFLTYCNIELSNLTKGIGY
jgi:hypothetical protein